MQKLMIVANDFDQLADLNACRRKLMDLHLMGMYANGVGFGNLSDIA